MHNTNFNYFSTGLPIEKVANSVYPDQGSWNSPLMRVCTVCQTNLHCLPNYK